MQPSTTQRTRLAAGLGLAITVSATSIIGVASTGDSSAAARALAPAGLSGAPAPQGDLPGWKQIFVDDFTKNVSRGNFPAAVSDKWGAYEWPWSDTTGKGRYDPGRVVSISNGILHKNLRTEGGQRLVAALTPKVPGSNQFGTLYGRYEVRMRSDAMPGYKVAFLLWPDSGSVTSGSSFGVGGNGEIDFPETDLDWDHVKGFVHRQNATQGSDQAWFIEPTDITKWHTYTVEWSPNLVVLYIDGREIGRTTERIPRTPMHWVLQTETSIRNTTPSWVNGNLQIDWVSVWKHAPGTQPGGGGAGAPAPFTVQNPAPGQQVSGNVTLSVQGVPSTASQVKWYIDGQQVAFDGSQPWTRGWNTRSRQNGSHKVFAKYKAGNGSWVTSRGHSFNIRN